MLRILLIDDDSAFRSFVRRALEREGHEIVEADDGRTGLQQLAGAPVDLVITDLIMPNMEGIEFILNLRRQQPKLRVIAMSGGGRLTPRSYLDIAQACGATAVLAKPFAIEQLLAAVAGSGHDTVQPAASHNDAAPGSPAAEPGGQGA